MRVTPGATSYSTRIYVEDTSGEPLTGLAYDTSGLVAYYITTGDAGETEITLASGTVGSWTSGGFAEVDATNMPGVYQIDVPNAAVPASDGDIADFSIHGAADMRAVTLRLEGDQTVGSRLATSGYTAPPSAADNATQVRTELTPELDLIDVAISTRLADEDYTAPPTVEQIDTELSSTHGSGAWETADVSGLSTLTAEQVWEYDTERTITGLTTAALAQFAADDTGETEAADGSVAKLAQGSTGGEVTFQPIASTVAGGEVVSSDLVTYTGEDRVWVFTVVDAAGDAVDLSGQTVVMYLDQPGGVDVTSVSCTVSGASNNVVTTAEIGKAFHATAGQYRYALRDTTDNVLLAHGSYTIQAAADTDS